jgi:TP901 family phage tail tape measure protein
MALPDIQVNVVVNLKGNEKIVELNKLLDSLITRQRTLSKTSRQAAASLKVQERAITANAKATRNYTLAQKALNTSVGSGNKSLRAYGNTAKSQYKVLEGIARKVLSVRKAFNSSIVTLQRMQAAYQKADVTIKGFFNRLQHAEKQMDALFRASYRLTMTGQRMMEWAQMVMGAFVNVSEAWAEYEFMLNRAAGALRLFKGDSKDAAGLYNALNDAILTAGESLALFPAEEVAKATYYWASTTGQQITNLRDIEKLMGAVNPLMKAAAMTQTDYESVIKGTYSILVQYGRSIADVEDVASKLFQTTQRTALEFNDLISSFKMVGPLASSMGVSFEDVAQLLGQLGDAGIRGTMAGRALRQTFIKLVRPTAKAREELDALFGDKYGKTFSEAIFPKGEFIGTTKYIEMLGAALKDMTTEQKGAILATITTANELPVMTALIDNQIKVLKGDVTAWDNAKTALGEYGSAVEDFNKSWGILAGSWKGLTSQIERGIEAIRIRLGKVLAEALTPAVEKAKVFLRAIEEWIEKNPEIISFMMKIAGAVAAFSAIGGAVLATTGAIAGLFAAFKSFAYALAPAVAQLAILAAGFYAFITALKRNWNYIVRTVTPSLKRLQQALGLTGEGMDGMKNAAQQLFQRLQPIFNTIVRTLADVTAAVLDFIAAIAETKWAADLLFGFAKAFALAFVAKKVLIIVGLAKAFTILRKAIMLLGPTMSVTATAARGLRAALSALMKVGPMLLASAAIMAAEAIASMADSAGIHIPIISDLFGEAGDSAQDAANKVRDFYDSLESGKKSAALRAAILQDSGLQSALNQARMNASPKTATSAITGKQETIYPSQQAIDAYKTLTDQATAAEDRVISSLQRVADYYGTSYDDVVDTTLKFVNKYGMNIQSATRMTEEFFKATDGGANLVPKSIDEMWKAVMDLGLNYKFSKDDLQKLMIPKEMLDQYALEQKAMAEIARAKALKDAGNTADAYKILAPMKGAMSGMSLDVEQAFNSVFDSIPVAIQESVDEATAVAEQAPSDIYNAFVTGLNSLGDIGKEWKGLKKNKNLNKTPRQIVNDIMGQFTDPKSPLNQALNSKAPALVAWGEMKAAEMQGTLMTTLGDWTGPQGKGEGKNAGKGKGDVQSLFKKWLLPDGKNALKFNELEGPVQAAMMDVYTGVWGNLQTAKPTVPEGSKTGHPVTDKMIYDLSQAWSPFKSVLTSEVQTNVNEPINDLFGSNFTFKGGKLTVNATATKNVNFNLRITGGTNPNTNAGAVRSSLNNSNFSGAITQAATQGILP